MKFYFSRKKKPSIEPGTVYKIKNTNLYVKVLYLDGQYAHVYPANSKPTRLQAYVLIERLEPVPFTQFKSGSWT